MLPTSIQNSGTELLNPNRFLHGATTGEDACQARQTPAIIEQLMHLQQSKDKSRKSGGQQHCLQENKYWLKNGTLRETISCAAVRLTDGSVYAGLFHCNALERARKACAKRSESCLRNLFKKSQDGFVTCRGRFVSRSEAYKMALFSHQITSKSYGRAVTDLWGYGIEVASELGAVAFNNARVNKGSKRMNAIEDAVEAKAKTWRLFEKILGPLRQIVNNRPDWKIHPETDTSVLMTFSKSDQLFYDVSAKDLDEFSSHRRAFFVFLAGSSQEAFIVPSRELREHVESSGLTPSQEYMDYKLHLIRDYRGTYFREIPLLNLAVFLNQYTQLL